MFISQVLVNRLFLSDFDLLSYSPNGGSFKLMTLNTRGLECIAS